MATQQLNEEVIFNTARKIESAEARAEYLTQVCGNNSVLRARIDELLEGYAVDSGFLESPPVT